MKKQLILIFLFLNVTLFAAQIVKDGNATAEIILDKNAEASVKVAAEELQKYIEKMSGARLDIVLAPADKFKTRLYVGESEATKKLGFTLKDVKYDGYKIWAKGDDVIVAGVDNDWYSKYKLSEKNLRLPHDEWEKFTGHKWRSPMFLFHTERLVATGRKLGFHTDIATGTLYGIYALLNQQGFHWYVPLMPPNEDLGKIIPKKKDIVIPEQETKKEPEFAIRDHGNAWSTTREEQLWKKANGVGMYECLFPIHLTGRILDGHEDPELAGKHDGKINWHIPKFSNPKFRDTFMEYLDCFKRMCPELPFTSFGAPDGWGELDDEDVANGWDKLETRGKYGRFSDYYWDFLKDIFARYNKKYPGNNLYKQVFAYAYARRIPGNLDKIPDDATVTFCTEYSIQHISEFNAERDMKEWLAKVKDKKQFLIYDYYYQQAYFKGEPPALPFVNTKLLDCHYSMIYDKCIGWTMDGLVLDRRKKSAGEGYYRPMINHLMMYFYYKKSWDRNMDTSKALDEYCGIFYGPASEEMRKLFRLCEDIWMRPDPRTVTVSSGYIRKTDIPQVFALLEKAKVKAPADSDYAKRIALLEKEMESLKTLFDKLERKGPHLCVFTFTDGEKPKVDGDLTKKFWNWQSRSDAFTSSFYPLKDMFTGEIPTHISTYVSFRWGANDTLYVAIECMEPKMDRLVTAAKISDDGKIYGDDFVEIRLETANGRLPVIDINPNGIIFDADQTMPNSADLPSFYTVKSYAVKRLSDRWTVEVAIDFKELGAGRPSRGGPCGIQVCRQRLAGNKPEYYMLSPTGTAFNKNFEMMGNIFVQ